MNIFNKIPLLRPKRNVFNLGFENRLSTDLFRLTPICIKEALPDDVFKIRSEIFARVMPALNAPIMQRFNIRTYWFFVPTRIIWDEFEDWINPKSGVSDIVAPRVQIDYDVINSPYIDMIGPKSLADYLGVNFGLAPEDQASASAFQSAIKDIFKTPAEGGGYDTHNIVLSSLPFRAYQQVFNDWFIDLNNTDKADFSKESGVEEVKYSEFTPGGEPYNNPIYQSLLKIRNRAWEHDYFTSAMPDPQRGPDVMAFDGSDVSLDVSAKEGNINITDMYVPAMQIDPSDIKVLGRTYANLGAMCADYANFGFASEADFLSANHIRKQQVEGVDLYTYKFDSNDPYHLSPAGTNQSGFQFGVVSSDGTDTYLNEAVATVKTVGTRFGGGETKISIPNSSVANAIEVSGSSVAAGVTVEELRIRMQMQSFLERNEIGGSRYTEMLYAHWGVKDPDGRLQRAEFIGGWKQPLMINEVSQTSAPTDDDPLGQYAGQGTSSSVSKPLRYRVPEHGFIIGLMCIMPRTGYFQGIEKMWSRFDRLDYYWPSFAHLGEQEVKNSEIMFSAFNPDGTFGYQQRYCEYKASYDQVHGDMKGNLSFWHGARAFATPESADDLPKLSANFTTPTSPGQDGIDRIFPVLSSEVPIFNADHFVVDVYNHIAASRRMPKFVTPRNGS